ncbi:MarR family winged helix-turn-helix transcriptional regulator [Leucobacter celer]|uniref:MarR family winged helix-turn-helix transcriptional regulator n=1 Tax=Leucobacter celer TaxID=668625 RepID=UPI0006A79538|nr:MarR family transcriptional regulator [Leucobacter celer]
MAEKRDRVPEFDERWRDSTLAEDLSFLLARANANSLAIGHRALRAFGLKSRSYSVLSLACDDLRPSQRELADFLRLDPSQVVAIIDGLEERGLVRRETDPRDRRSRVIVPSDEGRRLEREARAAVLAAESELHASFTGEERARFAELLRRLAFVPES